MKYTPVHIVLLLVARDSVYRKELRIANNEKFTIRGRMQNNECILN